MTCSRGGGGGGANLTLFRNYLSDLGDYLTHAHGSCMSETFVALLLCYMYSVTTTTNFSVKHKQLFLKKAKLWHSLPPRLTFYLFDSLARPIPVCGIYVCGCARKSKKTIDKISHWFIRCALKVMSTISNVIVVGESVQLPPNVYSTNIVCNKYVIITYLSRSLFGGYSHVQCFMLPNSTPIVEF